VVVTVSQHRALAVKDWRCAPRHTALEGLLTGAIQYAWPAERDRDDGAPEEVEDWEGLMGGATQT
jgi:hypothetical protein